MIGAILSDIAKTEIKDISRNASEISQADKTLRMANELLGSDIADEAVIDEASLFNVEDISGLTDGAELGTDLSGSEIDAVADIPDADALEGINNTEILSPDEISDLQTKAIREGIEKYFKGELDIHQKGNLAEMMMDKYFESKGYTPLNKDRVISLDHKGHQGLDGVYEKDGKFIVADAKYDQSPLGNTQSGRQMSHEWIFDEKRLQDSVGAEKAELINDAYIDDPENISSEIFHVSPEEKSLSCELKEVNSDGSIVRGSSQTVAVYSDMNKGGI